MANQLNTLYPPQVATFMPAFARTKTTTSTDGTSTVATDAVVYYSLSPYNEASKIKFVQASVVDQKTNENALNTNTGVIVRRFDPVKDYDDDSGMYKFVIKNSDIKGEQISPDDDNSQSMSNFKINQFYKVQLRFDLTDGQSPDTMNDQELGKYLIEQRRNFSEWSSICLLRPIAEPEILLRDLERDPSDPPKGYNKGIIPVSGYLSFEDSSETETMAYYQLQVLDENGKNVLLETDRIFTGMNFDQNDINYKLDIQGLDTDNSINFILRVIATTKNQYTTSKDYRFQVVDFIEDEFFNPKITVEVDNDDAIAVVSVANTASLYGTLYVKRASSKTNFTIWEDVYVVNVNGPVDMKVYDNTICSMVWYRYSVQLENVKSGLSPVFKSEKIFPDFFDAVFSRGSTQLSVRYNYIISSFKPVVNRAKVDTLGGKYPKFMENGSINYKQFTISGLISTQEDPGEKFMKYKETLGNNLNSYTVYKWDNSITEYYDYLWEREFREKVMAWLNDGEPKLYRSQTEGNLCVILTDISLTPNKTLSRRIWDFSATVYEVAEGMSMSDLHALGIYNIYADGRGGDGTLGGDAPTLPATSPDISGEIWKVGQMYEYNVTSNSRNFLQDISDKLAQRYTGYLADRMPADIMLKHVRIFFHGKPHLYIQGSSLVRITESEYAKLSEEDKRRVIMGYRFILNGSSIDDNKQIFVNDRGYYEVPDDVDVTSIFFPDARDGSVTAEDINQNPSGFMDGHKPEYVTVEYVIVYKETNSFESVVANTYVEKTVVGQVSGTFNPEEYVNRRINSKYSFSEPNKYFRRMVSWKGLSVDVTPWAMLKLKYMGEDNYETYEVGHGGYLKLYPKFKMFDMCFTGVRMTERPIERLPYLNPWEFVYIDPGQVYNDISEICEPKHNGVYQVKDKYVILYHNAWCDFEPNLDGTGLGKVPVEGAINYLGDVLISTY